MCRLTAYFGDAILASDLLTKPSRSIIQQSFDARERLGVVLGRELGVGEPVEPAPLLLAVTEAVGRVGGGLEEGDAQPVAGPRARGGVERRQAPAGEGVGALRLAAP